MTCSRRHQTISLADAVHLPAGYSTARCDECRQLILVAAPLPAPGSSVGTGIAFVVFGLAVLGVVGWAFWVATVPAGSR